MPATGNDGLRIIGCNYFTEGYWIVEYDNGYVGMEEHDGAPGPADYGLTPADLSYPDDDGFDYDAHEQAVRNGDV